MIRSFAVKGMHGHMDFAVHFHSDITVLTGRNGSGKTSLLKLIWYLMSGNIERALQEVVFEEARLDADGYSVAITCGNDEKGRMARVTCWADQREVGHKVRLPLSQSGEDLVDTLNKLVADIGSSFFFPTFRRIEGGFSMGSQRRSTAPSSLGAGPGSGVQQSVHGLAARLSVYHHRFVTAVSTDDITQLLTLRYADISGRANRLQAELSEFTLRRIGEYDSASSSKEQATTLIREIQERTEQNAAKQAKLFRGFTVLGEKVAEVFGGQGVKITDELVLGGSKNPIPSEALSAGEKQMLSFLCYNAFSEGACIIIDEPELSLHVDWQRQLFPVLLDQSSANQFIIATHSPFIYGKYGDREVELHMDRGASGVQS